MRHLQKNHYQAPLYKVETISGQSHCPTYMVSLTINESLLTYKEANSKRKAEQACELDILTQMNVPLTLIT